MLAVPESGVKNMDVGYPSKTPKGKILYFIKTEKCELDEKNLKTHVVIAESGGMSPHGKIRSPDSATFTRAFELFGLVPNIGNDNAVVMQGCVYGLGCL